MSGMPAARREGGAPERVQVLANFAKASVRQLSTELVPWLEERVAHVALATDIEAFARARDRGERGPRPDLVVVLGGDGALLGAVRAFERDPVPTLGIHLGRVGFLASTVAQRWREALEAALAGEAVLEQRLRLEGEWLAGGVAQHAVALNELCVQRSSQQGMLHASLSIGGTWVSEYRADGLLVATPSGSTAYSLSAGGPILEPSVAAFVVTAISPQALAMRPLVVHADDVLSIAVSEAGADATLAVDGQTFHPLEPGQELRLARHPVPYPLLSMPDLDPYRRLRERLGWGRGPAA